MKFSLRAAVFGALGLAALGTVAISAPVTSNYFASGSDWEIGGTLNIKTGAALKFNGVAQTGVVRAGETALDGSNPTAVTTGLASITSCTLTIKTSSAPGVSTSVVTYTTSSGTLSMYGWKPTSNADPTLVASTGTDTVGWVCVGS